MAGPLRAMLAVLALAVSLTAAGGPTQDVVHGNRVGPSAAIGGRVLDGEGSSPARFVSVQLSPAAAGAGPVSTANYYSASTDEHGVFVFPAVQPGAYYLVALKPTYAAAFYSADGSYVPLPGATIQVAAGERLRDLTLRVRKGGVIAGRVVDDGGDPVRVPVRVQALRPAGRSAEWSETSVSQPPTLVGQPLNLDSSDDEGRFRIYGLAPGDYVVMTANDPVPMGWLPDGRRLTLTRAFFPDTPDPMAAVPITIALGEERTDVQLTVRSVPLSTLSGTVAAPPDLVEFVSLRLMPVSPPGLLLPIQSGFASNGRFSIEGVPPGRYVLAAHSRQAPPPDAPAATPSLLWWTTAPVVVAGVDLSDVALAVQPALTLSGRIVMDEPPGQPADFSGYLVSLDGVSGERRLFETPSAVRPGADGRFSIINVTPARYRFSVRAGSGPAPRVVSVTIDGQALATPELDLSGATNITNVILLIRDPRTPAPSAPRAPIISF